MYVHLPESAGIHLHPKFSPPIYSENKDFVASINKLNGQLSI
ncbi:hypothetical protein CU011_0875 [Enterococcus faecium]|nr:hypothetical protein [Enterococcus faecium]MBK4839273.1 hypothetical protein [Enterococcus faecium]MBK4857967.1 hypothetical protein [Enterococcus faecium]MBK4861045.1 hypothetical protein [Enterococcus faecium]